MLLKDFAKITVGHIMPRVVCDEDEGDEVKVLMPKAISDGIIKPDGVKKAYVIKTGEKKLTQAGDIVMKLSPPYDAVHITEEYSNLLVPSFCAIIRLEEPDFSREYVVAYLNLKQVKDELAAKAVGTTRAMTRAQDIGQIDIPKVSEENMKLIGKAYELSEKKKRILNDMIEIEAQIMKKIITKVISEGGE